MKRKHTIAVFLSAAMIFSGCAESRERSERSLAARSTQSTSTSTISSADSAQSSKSSQGGAPSVIAPNFRGSSSSAENVPETSTDVPATEIPPVASNSETINEGSFPEISDTSADPTQPNPLIKLDVVGSDEVCTVSSGDSFYIEDEEMLEVKGTLIIESGAMLIVEKGGTLCVNGAVQLDGEIVLSDGGRLLMGHDDARVEGNGSVAVMDDFEQIDCELGMIYTHIIPPERVVENGVTTVGGIVIANKAIKLPPEYGSWLSEDEVTGETYNALIEMNNNSEHWYSIVSAYRSYYSQESIFKEWCDIYGFEKASTISSQAGHSEHQTGLTMDLDSLSQSYGDTAEGIWLAENCWKYGFIIRYPKGKAEITGYAYEPWHVRYLGKSTAKLVYNSGLTLEEFLNVEGGTVVID